MFKAYSIDTTLKKFKSQLANLLTMSNLFLGGLSILLTFQEAFSASALLIFLAALLDRFDGLVARKLKIESELGKQLDSMSDIISFGVAPALLLYVSILHVFDVAGMFLTVLYIGCGAFRLARFNISEANGYFIGLPITAAGCIATFNFYFINYLPEQYFLYTVVLLSVLMVSPFSIKKV